jgi:hypothetical protein
MVFYIVLLQAIPVFIIALWTKSKVALIIAAIIAGIIGVVTGNPAYMLADLIGVVIAFGLGISFINSQKPFVPPKLENPASKDGDSPWGLVVIGLLVAAYFYITPARNPPPPPTSPVVQLGQSAQPVNIESKPLQPTLIKHIIKPSKASSVHKNEANSDLRHCLSLKTDAEIMRCAN